LALAPAKASTPVYSSSGIAISDSLQQQCPKANVPVMF
jgi:hypothetical protein